MRTHLHFTHEFAAQCAKFLFCFILLFCGTAHVHGQNYGILKKIFDPDGAMGDNYGWSVAVSDSVAVVGAPMDDTGSVHVYFRNAGGMDNWGFVKRLTITDGNSGDLFGFSVSVSDTIIAVGAPNQAMPGSESGAVYVFHRNAGGADNWGQVAKIEDAGSQDHFGFAVSVSGTALAVGAPDETQGTVRIYYKDQGGVNNWGLVSTKVGNDSGDEFGYSIDLRDTLLVVGAPGDDVASNSDQGSAYVYYRDNDNWTLQQTITAADGVAQDRFGTSVAADSVTMVVGAPFNNEEGPNSGAAYIFQRDEGGADNWGYIGIKLVGSSTAADDEFGHTVSLSEDVILVGAPQDDDSGASSGTSFLFRQNQGGPNNWGETQRLQAFDAVSGDQYGFSVDIEGPFLYIGAPTDDDSGIESGSVYIYREDEIICPQTPTVDCQDITVYLDAAGVAEVTADQINSGASASCEFNVTLSQSIFSCDDIGTVQVTLTLIDLIGNQVECVANVTVEDTLAPVFVNCPPDTLTVSNNAGACEGNVIWSIPVAQDNCQIDSIVQIAGPAPGTSIPLGIYEISYVAYDPQLETDTCTFVLEIVDTQAPFLACPPDLTFDADADECDWTSAVGQLDPLIAIDNCEPILGYEITTSTGVVVADSGAVGVFDFPVGVNTICYMLTDSSMTDSDTCCFTVTVLDTQAPSVTCPADINVDTDPGVCEAEVTWTIPVPTDNCAVAEMTVAIMFADGSSVGMVVAPGDYGTMTMETFPEGVSSVVYTVTDTSGNMDACFFDVTVTDNEDPMLTCPGDVTVNTSDGGTGDCAGNYTFTHPTPTDNCEIASFTLQILNPSGAVEGPYEVTPGAMQSRDFDLGVSTISYIAVDASGNSVSCNYSVTVVDDEDPEFITCPPDTLTVGTDVDVCGAFVNWPTPIAEDNCGVESVVQIAGPMQGDSLAPGFYTITYVASDAATPANTDTCTFVLNVIDTQAPLLLCPSNDVVVSTDPGTCTWLPPAGSLTPTVAIGNCPYEITWEVYKDDTLQASGFDDVSGQHVFNLDTSLVCYYITETEDLDGNGILTDTCCFLVIVQDNEDPMITCPADVTFLDDDDMAEDCQHTMGGAALDASATDNCAVVSLTHDYPAPSNTTLQDAIFPVGVSVITWTAVDTAGNIETCSFTVTVEDNIDPFIDCPASVAIGTSSGGTGDCLGQYSWTHPTPTDNCEVTQYNYTISNADGTQSGPFDLAPLLNPNAPPSVFDASYDFQLGVSTITYFAADAAGNTFDCSWTVTVTDDENPAFINCPVDTITIGTDVDNCSAFVNWSVPIAEDNCEVNVTQIGGPSPGDELAPGFYTITYLAEDGATPPNTDTCEFVVNVVDTQEPLILCPSNDVVVSTDAGTCTWFAPVGSLTPTIAIANCPYQVTWEVYKDDTLQASGFDDVSGQHVFNLDTSLVCYYITETEDLDGNGILTDTCCFLVIVQDNEDPMIICPADVTFLDDDDAVEDCQHTVSGTALDATATDNCAVVSVTHDYGAPSNTTLDGAIFPVGITVVTWTAVDTAGNIETCSFIVTVEDNIDPFIDCPASVDIVTSDGGTGDCLGEYNWTHPTPTDNCEVTQYNYTVTNADGTQSGPFDLVPLLNPNAPAGLFEASFDFQLGTSTIEYFAADAAGNTFDCAFTVSVTDDEDPQFVNCPETDTITIGTDVDNCSSFVNWSIPIAEDNCEVTVTQIAGPSPGDELAPGFYTITYLAEDGAMPPNTDTCEFVINVVDTQEPLILCPSNDVVVSTDEGTCTWFPPAGSLTPVIAIANCPYEVTWEVYKDDTLQASGFNDVSGQHIFNLDTSFVCYYITETEDLDGNGILTDTCCFMVIVQDNELPMITCPVDVTFVDSEDAAEDCQHTVTGTALDATATDNCAVVSLTHDYPSVSNTTLDGAIFPVGITLVTWTAVDTAGNIETCRFVVTVEDDIDPEVICPEDAEITTSNNGTTGDCLGEYDWTHPTPTDNCAVTQYNYRIINSDGTISGPFDLVPLLNPGAPAELFDASYNFQLDTSIVEYYAEDAAGNFDTCTFTVIVTDDEAPMFLNCPPDTVTFGNEVDLCGAYANYAEPIAEDNCEVMVTQVAGPAPSDFVEPGFYIVIWVAVDPSGNSDTCEFVLRIIDTQLPDVECPSNEVVVATDPGVCTWTSPDSSLSPISAFDNCAYTVTWTKTNPDGSVDTGFDDVSGEVFDLDTTLVCYIITENTDPDLNGIQADTCCFLVIVEDLELPMITCPDDVTFEDTTDGTEDCAHTMGSTALDATASDNCAVVSLTHDYPSGDNTTLVGAVFPVGTSVITWTATDTAGNQSTCSLTVTVNDNVPPAITCPPDTIIPTSVGGQQECFGELEWLHPVPTDNCNIIEYTVTYTNPDGTTEGPVDLLNPPMPMGDRQFAIGVSTVTYFVEDSTGNTSSCSFTVTVEDDELPIFVNCPDTLTFGNDPSQCGALVNWADPIAVDNCNDTLNVVQIGGPASGSFIPVGVPTDITYQATDDEGNSVLCVFTVIVEDNEIPQAVCQDTVIYLDAAGNASITASDVDGGSFDNCGVAGLSVSPNTFTCADIGENNVLLTVTDVAGNADICVAEVTVLDTISPTFTCPPDSMISVCDLFVPDFVTGLSGTDNCSDVTFTQIPAAGVQFFAAVGDTFPVIITATDSSGNASSCVVGLIIFDEVCNPGCATDVTPPEWINCPRPPINVDALLGTCSSFVNFSLPVALDNCELDTIVQIDNTGLTSGDMFPVGLTILQWLAVDVEGNISDTCEIKIFVNDLEPPQLLCPDDTTAMNALGGCGAEIGGLSPIVIDNCLTAVTYKVIDSAKGPEIIDAGGDDASGDYGCGTFEVTYMVSDQPILLISEVTHELEALIGGTDPVPGFIQTTSGDDFVEITNYGPTAMDVSCLTIERIGGNDEVFVVPNGTVLQVGDVLTLHYGDGTDDPANFFFNVPGAADLSQFQGAGYVISVDTVALDVVAVNGFNPVGNANESSVLASDWQGNIEMFEGGSAYRKWPWDSNSAEDYGVADLCAPATIGSLNPGSDLLADIGITYSLQSVPPNKATCTFEVTIEDTELPQCGDLTSVTYDGSGGTIDPSSVFMTTINVPDAFEISDVNVLNLVGTHPDMSQITVKLSSPDGANVLLFSEQCVNQPDFNVALDSEAPDFIQTAPCGPLGAGGTYFPLGDLNDMNGGMSNGIWTLTIANADPEASATLTSWTLEISNTTPYTQMDTTLENDPGQCGANFTWMHPVVLDNCGEGEVIVEYTTEDGIEVPVGGEVVGGSIAMEFFEVGTTTVTYTISDKAGNTNQCSFDVTVLDTEIPVLVCPSDVVVSLGPGECASIQNIIPDILGDNCGIDSFTIDPPSGSNFDVGTTVVTIIAFDDNGNSDTCTFTVTVLAFIPNNPSIACNDTVNLSLGPDCMYQIGADVILEGDNYGCYDDFCIVAVDENGDTIPDATLTIEHIGQFVTVTVTDCEGTGLSCWATLRVEDKLQPVVACPPDITVACNESTDTAITGVAQVLSCELSVSMIYDDDIIDNGDCSDPRVEIFRTWIATDESGNVGTCVQRIIVEPFNFDMIQFPPDYIFATELLCEDVLANPDLTEPDNTGWPTINGLPIFGDHFCEINVGYWDEFLQDANCPGSYELLRHWIIRDECEPLEPGVNPLRHIQSINVKDRTAPQVDAWATYDPSFGSSNECTGYVLLGAGAADACTDIGDITWKALYTEGLSTQIVAAGQLPQDGYVNLTLGRVYTFVFSVEDECNHVAYDTVVVDLTDGQAPIAICDEHVIVSLTEDANLEYGLTKVPVLTFDDGSFDNCGEIFFDARRMTSCINFDWTTNGAGIDDEPNGIINASDRGQSYGPMVPFACCDVGAGPVMVELRVTDTEGNVNTCMIEVEVQDKLSPFVECLPEIVVSCDFWFAAEETNGFVPPGDDILTPVFGQILDAHDYVASDREEIVIDDPGRPANPNDPNFLPQPYVWGLDGWADDNCDVDITVRVRIFDDCSGEDLPGAAPPYATRLVERTFRVRDGQNNTRTCVQRIWVVDFSPFYISDQTCVNSDPNDGVIWPCHQEYTTCPGGIPVDYPVLFDDNCSTIGVNYTDTRFDFVEGACYKILRQWEVIDWCQYNAQTGAGYWTYVQEIKVLDSQGPTVTDCPAEPVVLCVADSNVTLPNNNQVFLGEGHPDASSCSVHVTLEHNVVETCSDIVIYDVKVYPFNGSDFIQMVNTTEVALDSNHAATLVFDTRTAADLNTRLNGLPYNDRNCLGIGGPKDYHRILWSIEDGCGNLTTCEYLFRLEDCKKPTPVCTGLSTVVMPSSGEVTIWAVDFNASSFDDCTAAEDLLYSFSGTSYQPSMTFDCAAIEENGSPSFIIEIWAADEGNDLDCNGTITWNERNKDFCTTFIVVDDNENVCPGDGSAGGAIETEELEPVENVIVNLTDQSGQIMSTFVTGDNGFYHFINPLLGYTITPARNDDHGNGVSTLDLIKIQKHLLGLQPLSSPYKMIAADANNSASISAIDLVQIRKLLLGIITEYPENTSWRFVDADYIFPASGEVWPFDEVIELNAGMSLDENFVAVKVGDVNGSVSANVHDIETRNSVGSLSFVIEDKALVSEEVVIPIRADQFEDILGMQFTLNLGGAELVDVIPGALEVTSELIGVHADAMTLSWFDTAPRTVPDGTGLFSLVIRPRAEAQLSDLLSIGSRITRAEAYNGQEELLEIGLRFEDSVQDAPEFALFQNEPNPFTRTTVIGFNLPQDGMAKLTITDVTGSALRVIEKECVAGFNQITVRSGDLPAGMLYYTLKVNDFSATKKMILAR